MKSRGAAPPWTSISALGSNSRTISAAPATRDSVPGTVSATEGVSSVWLASTTAYAASSTYERSSTSSPFGTTDGWPSAGFSISSSR